MTEYEVMQKAAEYIKLLSGSDDLDFEFKKDDDGYLIVARADETAASYIIGKRGSTIEALRRTLRVLGASRLKAKLTLKVINK